jgi:hypothetical protein
MLNTDTSISNKGGSYGPLGGGGRPVPQEMADAKGKSPLINIGVLGQGGKDSGKGVGVPPARIASCVWDKEATVMASILGCKRGGVTDMGRGRGCS